MKTARGIGLIEVLIAIPLLCILATVAYINFFSMKYKVMRAEVPTNVDGIKTASIAYQAGYGRWIEISSWTPSSDITRTQRSWKDGTAFDTLAWAPKGKVRGRYKVTSKSSTDILVNGQSDIDNDDDHASFTATKNTKTVMNTAADVY